MNEELVWYASYGSNLLRERFMCYIAGGKPEGSNRAYDGCRDKTAPRDDQPISIPHTLYFAGHSNNWNGAMAFVRAQRRDDANTLGRMYLLTSEQFDDVMKQERGLPVGGVPITPALSGMTGRPICYVNREVPDRPLETDKRTSYGRVLNLGLKADAPILTFTAVGPDERIEPSAPSRAYLHLIARGLHETYPQLCTEQILEYIASKRGVEGLIPLERLREWLAA